MDFLNLLKTKYPNYNYCLLDSDNRVAKRKGSAHCSFDICVFPGFKDLGGEFGESLCENDKLDLALELIKKAEE